MLDKILDRLADRLAAKLTERQAKPVEHRFDINIDQLDGTPEEFARSVARSVAHMARGRRIV